MIELEDVLSLDDKLLRSIFCSHSPPDPLIVRFPSRLIVSVLHDLAPYLDWRFCGYTKLLSWRCEAMSKAATARYASTPSELQELHTQLADYFLGTWAATPKPLSLTEGIVLEKCSRGVPPQCLRLPHSRRLNRRVLDELWRHLVGSGRINEALEECLLNPDWLAARCCDSACRSLTAELTCAAAALGPSHGAVLKELALSLAPLRNAVDHDGGRLLEQVGVVVQQNLMPSVGDQ